MLLVFIPDPPTMSSPSKPKQENWPPVLISLYQLNQIFFSTKQREFCCAPSLESLMLLLSSHRLPSKKTFLINRGFGINKSDCVCDSTD